MPVDEHKLHRDAGRALRAANLLENELLTEAFAKLETAYIEAWRSSPAKDTDGREKLFLAINVVGKVRDHLTAIVTNGKLAQAELNALAANEERRKKRFGII